MNRAEPPNPNKPLISHPQPLVIKQTKISPNSGPLENLRHGRHSSPARGCHILRGELANAGVTEVGRNAVRMFDVVEPSLDWVALVKGHGVVSDTAGFNMAFAKAMAQKAPV